MQTQLLNKQRKVADIARKGLEDLVGFSALEYNHCRSKKLVIELDELCDKLDCEL